MRKRDEIRWKAHRAVTNFKDMCKQHPEIALAVVTGAIGSARFIGKSAIKRINLNKQQDVKELYCYDRSLGHYWELRRKLNNHEWVEIDKRKRNGEKLADILDSMKVLK